ncbi:DUF1697 domain-containing protein [Enterococcus sp. UD-01]|jgi:uncharacterized protein (DUF1697 family)|uniref:DUF1697 domain-containing protein n=1 Tax=Enterococcus sp. UD-01 TaxID=3373911 RepID=UPI0038386652
MKRYIALLRGINISGKNKLGMTELKKECEKLGFMEVVTYLNSGNIIFSSPIEATEDLSFKIKVMIQQVFGLAIPVYVLLQEELQELLAYAPDWWGSENKASYDNLIFILPPLSYEELYAEIGAPHEAYEKIYAYKNTVFWSFSRKDYQKTNWWSKTATSIVKDRLTIRTANTVRKIAVK